MDRASRTDAPAALPGVRAVEAAAGTADRPAPVEVGAAHGAIRLTCRRTILHVVATDTAIVVAHGAAAVDVVTVLVTAGSFTIQVTIGAFGTLAELPVAAVVFVATVQGCGGEQQQKGQDPGQGAGIYDHSQGVLSSSFARSDGPGRRSRALISSPCSRKRRGRGVCPDCTPQGITPYFGGARSGMDGALSRVRGAMPAQQRLQA